MKNLIIILAICSLFSCKKEDAVTPSPSQLKTDTPLKKDSVFIYVGYANRPTYYSVEFVQLDYESKEVFKSKTTGYTESKADIVIKLNGMKEITKNSRYIINIKSGATTEYSKTLQGVGNSLGNLLPQPFIERTDYYKLMVSTGGQLN